MQSRSLCFLSEISLLNVCFSIPCSYESMKTVCDRYNRARDGLLQLVRIALHSSNVVSLWQYNCNFAFSSQHSEVPTKAGQTLIFSSGHCFSSKLDVVREESRSVWSTWSTDFFSRYYEISYLSCSRHNLCGIVHLFIISCWKCLSNRCSHFSLYAVLSGYPRYVSYVSVKQPCNPGVCIKIKYVNEINV